MKPGQPPEGPDRDAYLADDYHQRFQNARAYLRDGHPPEDAADLADIPLDAFVDALDSEPEDIRGTNWTACDGCGEGITPYVSAGGGTGGGEQSNHLKAYVSWCAWDDAGIPVDARPDGWRKNRPEDGFPCPGCSEELTPDSISYFNTGKPEYRAGVRCGHCGTDLGGEDGR